MCRARGRRGPRGGGRNRDEIVRHALGSVADEMALIIARTAYSATVRDALDYSTALLNPKGELIAQGLRDGLPGAIELGHRLTAAHKLSDGRIRLTFSTPSGTVERTHDERETIAGVYHNRLRIGMPAALVARRVRRRPAVARRVVPGERVDPGVDQQQVGRARRRIRGLLPRAATDEDCEQNQARKSCKLHVDAPTER